MGKFIISAFADEIDMDLTRQMDVLDQHDIKYIEMRGVNGKGLVQHTTDEVREIKRQIDARGFKLSAVGSPIGKIKITDDFEPHLDLFKHTVEIARLMETRYIRMFSFFIPEGDDPVKYRDEVMERWGRFLDVVKGSDIILLHENEKDIYGDIARRCLDIVETMNSAQVKAIFDPANFIQCDEETYPKAYEMLKEHVVYMHIKDALYSDHSVTPSGQGDGRVREILADLYKNGFEGFLSLEPHLGSFTGMSELERDLDTSSMEEGGPKKFAIAAYALKKIVSEIEA